MSWQEYNEKVKELDSQDYAREFLKTNDEDFAKDYKLVDNLNLAASIGFGMFVLAGIIFAVQGFTCDEHDSLWLESAKEDIYEGKDLLEKARMTRTTLPPDENNYASIEEEYK